MENKAFKGVNPNLTFFYNSDKSSKLGTYNGYNTYQL